MRHGYCFRTSRAPLRAFLSSGVRHLFPIDPYMYIINQHHRNGNSNKSQWTINKADEEICFTLANSSGWILSDKGWGLHFVSQKPTWLGVAQNGGIQLFIAKFVGDSARNEWHGYPANYRNNHHDIPESEILKQWLSNSVLNTAKVRKITKGQPCNP